MSNYIPTMNKEELVNYRKIVTDDIARLNNNRNKSLGDKITAEIGIVNDNEELKEIDDRLAKM